MSFDTPTLVMCLGRSGSSLVTKILAEHGAWVGRCMGQDHRNPTGYYEHHQIKQHIKSLGSGNRFKLLHLAEPDKTWRGKVERWIAAEGYTGGPWAVKHSAIYYRLWDDFPGARFVLPRRNPAHSFKSIREARFCHWMTDSELWRFVNLHLDTLDYLESKGGIRVDTQALVDGDRDQIRAAVEQSGMVYSEEIVNRCINREFWHHGSTNDARSSPV